MSPHLVQVRTPLRKIYFHCPDDVVGDALASLSAEPRMPPARADRRDLEIVPLGDGFYDFTGAFSGTPGTARSILVRAGELLTRQILEDVAPDPIVMGGSLVLHGRRFLILSEDPFARRTFMLQCLSEAWSLETDGWIAVHGDTVSAIPSRMRVDRRDAALFPNLLVQILASPAVVDWDRSVLHALALDTAGVAWECASGPADALIFLEPNCGGHSAAGRLAPDIAFPRLLQQVLPRQSRSGEVFAKLHRLSRAAVPWRLQHGTPAQSMWHLERIARSFDWRS